MSASFIRKEAKIGKINAFLKEYRFKCFSILSTIVSLFSENFERILHVADGRL